MFNKAKKNLVWPILGAVVVLAAVAAYAYRQDLRDAYERWKVGPLPASQPASDFSEANVPYVTAPSSAPASVDATLSQDARLRAAEPKEPPPASAPEAKPLPAQINLKVPMVYQAPFSVWDAVHEDACEEASMMMVRAFYDGRTLTRDEMEKGIQDLVAYEIKTIGYYQSTDAAQNAKLLRDYFNFQDVQILPVNSVDDIRREVAAGRPVILPAYGKALQNPNFKNGGPEFHMLVVRGYKPGYLITNDPGTRKGENYVYTDAIIMDALHDWNGGDVPHGAKVMIIAQ